MSRRAWANLAKDLEPHGQSRVFQTGGRDGLAGEVAAITTGFRLLGSVETLIDGQLVDLGHPRQRCVLVVLLIEANKLVSADQLMDRVWGADVPHRGRQTLYSYLSRLRRALAPAHRVDIAPRSGGYVLSVDPMVVDLHRFHRLAGQARSADEDDHALASLEQALGLWHGEPFTGLDTPWLNEVRGTLQRQRLALEMDRTDLLLRRGQHGNLVAELSARAAADPLDERLAGQLMLALYLSGRQVDALEHYRRLRRRLAQELGTDPGGALQQVHQRILNADPTLTPPPPVVKTSMRVPIPRQLPAAPRLFTGREGELARLTAVVDISSKGGVLVISAIGGSGGIGKTWLAVRWAHQNIHRFPDGQLYVNLNGFAPTGEPLPPAAAARGFLEALGVDPSAIPMDPQARTGLYRSLMADRRMLIILDNARDTAQVIPLLPGDSACVVLVTSRNRLDGLVTTHGATPLALDVLTDDQARQLLVRHVGEERVAAEPAAAAELLDRCAGLPLAIGILAARAATTPTLSMATLADELRDQSTRLDTISTGTSSGDLATNLREVFSGSFHALTADAARLFRLLGVAQLPDVGVAAAASLSAVPVGRVRGSIRELETAHLVQQHVSGRYRMHDLVRLYAYECAQRARDEQRDHAAALQRLVDFYLHTAYAAARLLYPHLIPITLEPPVPGGEPEQLHDAAEARAWFETEYTCLTRMEQLAAQRGWDSAVWRLAWSSHIFRQRRGYHHDNVSAWLAGVASADRVDSPNVQAIARLRLAQALGEIGRPEEAREHLRQGLTLAESAGDARVQARIHNALAHTWATQGNGREAILHATISFELTQTLDNPRDLALMLGNLGWYQAQAGQYGDARASCEAALRLTRELSLRDGEGAILDSLGYIAHQTGELHDALRYYREALDLARDIGNAHSETDILEHLGETYAALHLPSEARHAWRTAAQLFDAQHRLIEAERLRRRLLDL
jgi:DNA-binding SARP family transcriptional activator/tetratricopeptide (TPR) repeat protein